MSERVFVYGTLMRTAQRSNLLGDVRRRPARTLGRLYALPAGYPALGPGNETVFGELCEDVPAPILAILDAYEGVPEGLYERRKVRVRVDTEDLMAWTFWMENPMARGGRHLKTGRYEPVRRR